LTMLPSVSEREEQLAPVLAITCAG